MQYDEGSSKAIITFEDINATERVLQKESLSLRNASLSVSPVSWRHLYGSNQRTTCERTSDINEERKQTEEAVAEVVPSSSFQMSPNSHKVTGIHTLQILDISGLSAEYIKLILEKDIKGSIEIVDFKADAATVRFQHQQDASYLLQHGSIVIEGRRCQLVPLYTAIHDRTEGSFAIRVGGLNENITEDLLEMVFENRRRSGGYNLRSIYMLPTGGEAIITFHCRDAVNSVLGMQNRSQLKVKNAQLLIEEMKPLPPPPFIVEPAESTKMIMTEVPSVDKEDLELFLSGESSNISTSIPRVHIAQVQYAYKKNVILLEFEAIPDYDAMLYICVTFPLKDRMTSLQKVAMPTRIIVRGVDNLDEEDLTLYFEDSKSGGGEIIEEISFHYNNQCAVINFGNYQVAKSVLKRKHKIRGQAVEVDAFYPVFGTWPSDYNPLEPWHSLPQPFSFKIHRQEIVDFFSWNSEAINKFNSLGKTFDVFIALDKTKDSELHISYLHNGAENIPKQKEWEEKAREVINKLMDSICVEKIAFNQNCYDRIKEEVNKTMTKDGSIHLKICQDQSIMVITGWNEEVNRFLEMLQPAIQHIQEEFMQKTQSITECVPLKHHERTINKAGRHTERLRQKSQGVEVAIKNNYLTLIGPPQEVNKVKLYVYENITQMIKCRQYQFSKNTITFLKRKMVKTFIISELKKAGVVVVPEFADSQVNAYAMSDHELEVYGGIVKKYIVERRVPLQNESKHVFQHSAWQSFKTELVATYKDNILIEEERAANEICLITLSDLADMILENINSKLQELSVFKTEYPVSPPIFRLISEFYNDEVKAIESRLNCSQCNITQSGNGFVIKGNQSVIISARQALKDLCSKVCWRDHLIDNQAMIHYFESHEAAEYIKLLEISFKVVCIILNSKTMTIQEMVTKVDQDSTELYSTTIEQATIRILIGDITKQNVDAIVNAANGRLKMSGGVAAAILNAGGKEIQAECDRYMAGRKDLLAGEVHVSKPGRLPCKIIIHAVGPTWKDGKSGEENELFEAVSESLDQADRAGMQSIAIPVISAGVYGFPLPRATKIICEAVTEHFKQKPSSGLKCVHLIDNKPECGQSLVKSLKACKQQSVSDKAKPSTSWQLVKDKMKKLFSVQGQTTNKIHTPEGIIIWIKQGNLSEEKVDVIVNTTREDFKLSLGGGVSSVIINAAGNIIQQECDMKKPAHVKAGDIVPTSGGKLPVRKILHGFCGQWNGGKDLRRFVSNALNVAHNDGCQSIAFPAIGTGNLNYDAKDVARLMVEEIKQFSASMPATNLKDVRIILHQSNTAAIKAFEAYWKSVAKPSKIRKLCKEEEEGASVNTSCPYSIIQETKDMLSFQLSSLIVLLKKGDITKENTEAIMNSTDGKFSEAGAIEQAIMKAGGNTLKQECAQWLKQYGSLPKIAITGAGNLPCKKIVHVNVTSGKDWFFLFLKVLIATENIKMISLAIPAIGSGNLNKMPEQVCQKIMQALVYFAFEVKPKYLKSVSVVVFDKLIFEKYKTHMEQELKDKGSGILPEKAEVPPPASVTYRIYGMDQKNISLFITKLNDFRKSICQIHEFKDEEEQHAIALMDPSDIQKVKALEDQFKVSITVTQGVRLNRIVVQGTVKNLALCISKITKILHQVENKHEEQAISKMISKQVKWQFLNNNTYTDYPHDINYIIEKAFSKNEKLAEWKEEDGEFKICFDKMKERRNDDPTTDCDVRRQTEGSLAGSTVQLPSDWAAMGANEIYKKVTLAPTSSEYQQVAQRFSLGGIKSISRIQNPNLYQLYELKKKQMESTNPGIQNEKLLFHGTAEHNLQNINSYGFNRSYCGKHGTALGEGVYFAANASYSAQPTYATPNSLGQRHMYLATVLVGRTTVGQGNLKEPPYLNGVSGERFDSVSDQAQSVFVVFKDSQAYPAYLITF